MRPAFERLLVDVEAGKFDVLLAVAEDRLSRIPSHKLQLLAACEAGGVTWETQRAGKIDPTNDEAELFAFFRGLSAKRESFLIGKRQKAANLARRDKGLPIAHGARPFGYEPDKLTVRV